MKTLHLTLKKQWFDMILSGEKKEEYREIKPYWSKRLINENFSWDCETRANRLSHYHACPNGFYKKFDTITFTNGYKKDAPQMVVEFLGFKEGLGYKKWGAETAVFYYVIELGKILKTKNSTVVR